VVRVDSEREQYGKLPVKLAEATVWKIVQVELIGPWKVKTPSGVKTLICFTAIDPALFTLLQLSKI
jgi:hypothetical protein